MKEENFYSLNKNNFLFGIMLNESLILVECYNIYCQQLSVYSFKKQKNVWI